jgi:glycosyltransferase involved in cell wall biosynthesis
MSAPCRVLILNERDPLHPRAGGAEVHVAEIARRLAAAGFELTLAACGFRGAPAEEFVDGMRVRRLGPLPAYYPRVVAMCASQTRRGRYDVVVEHLNKLPFCSPVYSAVPVVSVCHHLFGESAFLQVPWPIAATVVLSERLIPRLYRRTPFVAVSESSKDDLVARGIDAARIRVIHNGITPPKLDAPPLETRPCRVAYLGRLEPYKRVDVLLRVAARLVPRFPDLEIVVIGRGQTRPELERVASELGIADRTRFAGFVSDAERDELVAGARVCVCPSVKEGWGITVIEANAVGTPVVATDAPGLRDAVRHGETGFLAADGDEDAFEQRIAELLLGGEQAEQLSRAARAWAQHFDWDLVAPKFAEVFLEARGAP